MWCWPAVCCGRGIFYANSFFGFPASLCDSRVCHCARRHGGAWSVWMAAPSLRRSTFRQLPDTIEMVTSAVRSGLPVSEAFRTIAREMPQPTAGQFAHRLQRIGLGRPPEEAIEDVYQRTQVAEYGFFAVTLGVQMKSGGSSGRNLADLWRDTVRQRVAMAARAKALAGEVIFSASALSLAPLIVGGLLYSVSPQLVDLLLTDPTGKKLLAYAGSFGACRDFGDTLDDQKGYGAMTSALVLAALAMATATADRHVDPQRTPTFVR